MQRALSVKSTKIDMATLVTRMSRGYPCCGQLNVVAQLVRHLCLTRLWLAYLQFYSMQYKILAIVGFVTAILFILLLWQCCKSLQRKPIDVPVNSPQSLELLEQGLPRVGHRVDIDDFL